MSAVSSDDQALIDDSLFKEPAGYFEPDAPPTYTDFTLLSGQTLRLRLVGHNPLWGHHLWNGAQTISAYLQQHAESLVRGKDVLELGAGAGLPSIVAAILGARKVVVTDFPDEDLISNLTLNIESCKLLAENRRNITAQGYLWGQPASPLLFNLPRCSTIQPTSGFDLLILADVLFNHSEHSALIATIQSTLKRSQSSKALVFFTPYRPWLLNQDMAFFKLATIGGFVVEKVLEEVMEKVMFENDPGDVLLRRTVYGYELKWAKETS